VPKIPTDQHINGRHGSQGDVQQIVSISRAKDGAGFVRGYQLEDLWRDADQFGTKTDEFLMNGLNRCRCARRCAA
jgi:hypothetical protein